MNIGTPQLSLLTSAVKVEVSEEYLEKDASASKHTDDCHLLKQLLGKIKVRIVNVVIKFDSHLVNGY